MESKRKRDGHQVIPYPLRLPPALREQLQAQAARNQRSLNGEIVYMLQRPREADQQPSTQGTAQ